VAPLHVAAESGHKKIVSLLLDRGADIEAKAMVGLWACLPVFSLVFFKWPLLSLRYVNRWLTNTGRLSVVVSVSMEGLRFTLLPLVVTRR
jgi:ankyrin repeat protein